MKIFPQRVKSKLQAAKHKLMAPKAPEPNVPTFVAHFNSPTSEWVKDNMLTISGWLLASNGAKVERLRIKNNTRYIDLPYGLKRHDVLKAYPNLDPAKTLHSGFSKKIQYDEGLLQVEVDLGRGWQVVRAFTVKYSPEELVDMLYNPDLAWNMAEHTNLMEGRRKYYFEPATDKSYKRHENDPRLVPLYLPQFHPIEENDKFWSKGFTEWTNVTAAKPRFVGHQQPLLPSDLGFYDLRMEESLKAQIDLAKQHGIYGFCFYYYWFSGKRLLEKPLDIFLKHKEWDFNFMISWANENWTKRWDGLDNEVIVAQKYLEDDPLTFIKDVEHILLDPRYIREDGKPVLVVYRGSKLGDPARYVQAWRDYFRKKHNQELHILSTLGFDVIDPRKFGFDAGMEFEPLTAAKRTDFNEAKPKPLKVSNMLLDKDFQGGTPDYRQIALRAYDIEVFSFPTYKSVMPSWDNDARRKGNGPTIFHGANPDIYAGWLDRALGSHKNASPLLFINAWNEWAEGAVLEPSQSNGNAILNRTTEVLAKYSHNKANAAAFPMYGIDRSPTTKLAVVVHIFYKQEWLYIKSRLKMLPVRYGLFITITERNKDLIEKIKAEYPDAVVTMVPNRGRDILPFLFTLLRLKAAGYEYVLKMHTKRSTHRSDGEEWFKDLINKLLPSPKRVAAIVQMLEEGAGMVGPAGHFISQQEYLGSNHGHMTKFLHDRYEDERADEIMGKLDKYGYFGGSMLWARIDAFDTLQSVPFIPEEFESERSQIDGTAAHAVERLLTLMPLVDGKPIHKSDMKSVSLVTDDDIETSYKYV
jgi:lipopolysaccharide biosynthesis protein